MKLFAFELLCCASTVTAMDSNGLPARAMK